ncbi:alpha-glucuronidase [Galbibacter marinus]|uniref:Xylan alpha-1,2-glucuronidase n=1 Tax=Galbibacter marinus TaxID=555500 RepID=K2Q2Z0_9FLAO|nr:alpha-glucuronidase [Galbibacter marinus]
MLGFYSTAFSQSGYGLWLDYEKVNDASILSDYQNQIRSVYFLGESETLNLAREELKLGLNSLLGSSIDFSSTNSNNASITVATFDQLERKTQRKLKKIDIAKDGYYIGHDSGKIVITAKEDIGILYGVFNFIRLLQTQQPIDNLAILDAPKIDLRILNHWDNLDGTIERGYAGKSLWKWQKLPKYIDQRYIDYARANASIGINGTVLTNVNANAWVLTPSYIDKVAALADAFRPYGIKVYLTARFSAPIEIGGLSTADPLEAKVQQWWKTKIDSIYAKIPDFGGFLVKANSEGQPGPQNYGRTHVDGANMMAEALEPHNGVVLWRAFVYSEHDATDRAKQAYSEFVPMDGKFKENVIVQVKNGAIDFQPREPFHPIFGAMPKTALAMEFQITQEYLGFSTHLVFLPKLYEEVLQADTYQQGKGSLVAKVIDGSLDNHKISAISGVSNIGSDLNWTGHPFAQANWYGYGRLAWDPYLDSETIAEQWLRSTYSNDKDFVKPMTDLLIESREAVVNYMTPLGLHHMMDTDHHYGPGPWVSELPRPEWNPTYYHKADSKGIGFDRTKQGSDAIAQYADPVAKKFEQLDQVPENLLLWFHHLPWDYTLSDGKTLWNSLGIHYQKGVDQVREMKKVWEQMSPYVDPISHKEVSMLLDIQLHEAIWWKDACMLYFQKHSKLPFPKAMEKPKHSLKHYKSLKHPYAPGI